MSLYPNPHQHSCPWYPYAEAYGSPNVKWCEETLCQWISEPSNTWSNIAYLIAALFIWYRASRTNQKELIFLAPGMFIMGAFSLFYHASNFYISQVLDFVGMYLFIYWLIILNFRRLNWVSRERQVPLFIIMTVASTILLHAMYINYIKIQLIIAAAVALILFTEYRAYKKSTTKIEYKAFLTGLIFVGVAQALSLMDGKRVLCNPTSWFQGHAAWHIIAAIGLSIAYIHWEQFKFDPNAINRQSKKSNDDKQLDLFDEQTKEEVDETMLEP